MNKTRGAMFVGALAVVACADVLGFPDRQLDTNAGAAGLGGSSASGGGAGAGTSGGAGMSGSSASGGAGTGGTGGTPSGGTGGTGGTPSGGTGGTGGTPSGGTGGTGGTPSGGTGGLQDGGALEGGTPLNPGMVWCGQEECPTNSTTVCCADPATGSMGCTAQNQCSTPKVKIACDEAADCGSGAICCATTLDGSAKAFSTKCSSTCAGTGNPVQLCKLATGECAAGSCKIRSCVGGATIQSCTSSPGCP